MRLFSQLAAVALLGASIVGCGGEESESPPELRPVRYERVAAGGVSHPRTLAGVVRSGVESRLSFRVPGTVETVAAVVGQRVRERQLLARLDPTDYELRVEEAEAALAQGLANLRKAEADYDRVRALYESNNASKSELDAARAAAESAAAQVKAATKQLEQARQQLGYTSLAAPAAGAIASVDVEVNENVQAGQEICLLVTGGEPEVALPVPEVLITQVEVGQEVKVTLDALPGRSFTGEVTEVGVAVTGAAATFAVTVRMLEADMEIRSGMAAEVTFEFTGDEGGEGVVVPWVAVGEDRQGRYVYVLEPEGEGEGTVRRRGVAVGEIGREVEILEGLEEGELVVTAGVRRLSDGMRVRLLEPVGGDA